MSDVLTRLRVKEEHGIRRFLYPLSIEVTIPVGTDLTTLSLATAEGEPVPLQVTKQDDERCRIDFAVSLHPQQELHLEVAVRELTKPVLDPLCLSVPSGESLRSSQERFEITLGENSQITRVIYDEVAHLTNRTVVVRTDYQSQDPRYLKGIMVAPDVEIEDTHTTTGGGPLAAWSETQGHYSDGCEFTTRTELTACKSWAMMTHTLQAPRSEESLSFGIPLTVASPVITFDTGVGNGIYGKVQPKYVHIVWQKNESQIRWASGTTKGRNALKYNDYIGVTERQSDFEAQRWFHIIDGRKALAVAITRLPAQWDALAVTMTPTGTVNIKFRAENLSEPVEFGVCYHFLNDVPAIAAATNPQSILLPPTVEVLP